MALIDIIEEATLEDCQKMVNAVYLSSGHELTDLVLSQAAKEGEQSYRIMVQIVDNLHASKVNGADPHDATRELIALLASILLTEGRSPIYEAPPIAPKAKRRVVDF